MCIQPINQCNDYNHVGASQELQLMFTPSIRTQEDWIELTGRLRYLKEALFTTVRSRKACRNAQRVKSKGARTGEGRTVCHSYQQEQHETNDHCKR